VVPILVVPKHSDEKMAVEMDMVKGGEKYNPNFVLVKE
jgi:hypothetical protein